MTNENIESSNKPMQESTRKALELLLHETEYETLDDFGLEMLGSVVSISYAVASVYGSDGFYSFLENVKMVVEKQVLPAIDNELKQSRH